MKCEKCNIKVNARNIVRSEDLNHIYCNQCFIKTSNKTIITNEKLDEVLAKTFVYTYALLYKNKMIQ
jgi:hypothetical protein